MLPIRYAIPARILLANWYQKNIFLPIKLNPQIVINKMDTLNIMSMMVLSKFEYGIWILAIVYIYPHIVNYIKRFKTRNKKRISYTYMTDLEYVVINELTNNVIDAIHYYMIKNNKITSITASCTGRKNYIWENQSCKVNIGKNIKYQHNDASDIYLENDIYCSFESEEVINEKMRTLLFKIHIESYVRTTAEIEEFINNIVKDYEQYLTDINRNIQYHFVYLGTEKNMPVFKQSPFSNRNSPHTTCHETFDFLFHEHKDRLVADVKRMHDIEYYSSRGLKRKMGYLFYGEPGCGKTSTVTAIANADRRHIIEIPLAMVKTSQEFIDIINMNKINDINITDENSLLLLDEIDGCRAVHHRSLPVEKPEISLKDFFESASDNKPENTNKSSHDTAKLTLHTVLSQLDGIKQWNGKWIIATTNSLDKLDPAIYRSSRLTALKFGLARKIDIINIIKSHFRVDDINTDGIPDKQVISHADARIDVQSSETVEEALQKIIARYVK